MSQRTLALPQSIRERIIGHAQNHTPRECCGVITGSGGEVTELYELTNLEPGNTRYLIDDGEFFRTYWEIEQRGEELLAVYHSHPATIAYPSPTDIANATWPEAVYLICSLEHPEAPVIRGFLIIDGDITEVALT